MRRNLLLLVYKAFVNNRLTQNENIRDRLIIRSLTEVDSDDYYDIMGNPNVMNMISREVMSRQESDKHLRIFIGKDQTLTYTKVWGFKPNLLDFMPF